MKKGMTNINVELFKRYAPSRKLEIINGLTEDELLFITKDTLLRIVKEAGENRYKSRDKELRIASDRRAGNNWNSTVEDINTYKGNLYLNIYCQTDSTDTNISESWDKFICGKEYRATQHFTNRYGDSVPHYFLYYKNNKAAVVKSILLEYVCTKYADKLK